ncbi:MAG: hydrogen gas-evolving membrane-bound hydrogenase subunit E [Mycobacterium sp.]
MSDPVSVVDITLGVGVAAAAVVATFHPKRAASVTVFVGAGVLLVGIWARLGAADVALAEAALAAGVTGALLIATVAHDGQGAPGPTRRRGARVVGELLLALGMAGALTATAVPAANRTIGPDALARQATAALDNAAVVHPVTAVLLDFRAYDTLLEIVVLTVAAISALALQPRGEMTVAAVPTDRRPALTVLFRALAPVLVLLAAWLLVAGSTRPGGAFQSGAVLTGLIIMGLITGAIRLPRRPVLPLLIVVGAAMFVALAGLTAVGGGWLTIGGPFAVAAILALETAMAVSIGAALATLLVAQEPSR